MPVKCDRMEGLSVMSMSVLYICLPVLRQKNITIDDYHKMNHCQEAVAETPISIPLL